VGETFSINGRGCFGGSRVRIRTLHGRAVLREWRARQKKRVSQPSGTAD
jgi:ribosomal protein L34